MEYGNNDNIEIKESLNYMWKKIPFKFEIKSICNYIHVTTRHGSLSKCKQKLLTSEYYWEGCTKYLEKIIKDCVICAQIKPKVAAKPKIKQIITNGPHIRYIADLWELEKNLSNKIGYKYILELVDHYSKWMWCYPLKNKESITVLLNIKKFFLTFGNPVILQTDNGSEFANKELRIFCENNKIKLINSSPHHPRTNGAIEVAHKNLQKAIQLDLLINGDNFNIDETILNCLKSYNLESVHSSTGYKPIELRDNYDEFIINKVIEKEKKIFERFENFELEELENGKKYLLIKNAKKIKKKGVLMMPNTKKNRVFTNPIKILDIKSGGNIKIKIVCDTGEFKKDEIWTVNYKLLSECSELAWEEIVNKLNKNNN